jgi:hypothetical protein
LLAHRLRAPASVANIARNARAGTDRHARWRPVRDAVWALLDARLTGGERVAIVGAGNGHDLPLGRLADRAREVVLIDLDAHAASRARRRQPRHQRRNITVIEHDITTGAADAIARAAQHGHVPDAPLVSEAPLPGAPYDIVIGDLFYSQLLYPALIDLGVDDARRRGFVERYGPALTRAVVCRLHASAPDGRVVHLHDPLAWWPGHAQAVALEPILTLAERDPEAALRLAARGRGPRDFDPRRALHRFAIPIAETAVWRWPFAPGVDYLVCATVTDPPLSRRP